MGEFSRCFSCLVVPRRSSIESFQYHTHVAIQPLLILHVVVLFLIVLVIVLLFSLKLIKNLSLLSIGAPKNFRWCRWGAERRPNRGQTREQGPPSTLAEI